jgi:hypothetical protein
MARVVILTGAPTSAAVQKSNSATLLDAFTPSFAAFLGYHNLPESSDSVTSIGPATADIARWRQLTYPEGTHIPSGFSQLNDIWPSPAADGQLNFLDTTFLSVGASQDTDNAQTQQHQELLGIFYEHSRAIHDDGPSSQLPVPEVDADDGGDEEDTTQESASFLTTTTTATDDNHSIIRDSQRPAERSHIGPARSGRLSHLSDLDDLPNAAYITRVAPATVSVNLIVGIISISPPRSVSTRYGERRLQEVLVGDDSCAGFQVTFWLDDRADQRLWTQAGGTEDGVSKLEYTLSSLRPQDILLMQNVGLNVFMDRVYGSSLRRGLTRVFLLYRALLDADDVGGYNARRDLDSIGPDAHPQVEKTRRVRDWVLQFVGPGTFGQEQKRRGKRKRAWDEPPADETQ